MWLQTCLAWAWACRGHGFSGGAAVGGSRVFGDEHSSLLLPGFPEGGLQSDDVTRWQYVTPGNKSPLLQYDQGRSDPAISEGYKDRVKVNPSNEPPLMRRLEVGNSSDQVRANSNESRNRSAKLTVQKQLLAPLIVQDPTYVVDRVELNCFVRNGKASGILWQKDNKQLLNSSRYRLVFDNTTLFIKDMKVSDCGLYTCTVKNGVSTSSNSHFLTVNGILLILSYAIVMSVVALVSNLTSTFAASFIIFIALKKFQVQKHQKQLTAIFVAFQLLSFICLLIACLFCISDAGFSIWYKVNAAFGCFLGFAMVIYVVILFLNAGTEQSPSFLSTNSHRNIILVCGPVSVVISSAPIYKATQIVTECRYPYEALAVKGLLSLLIYIFAVVIFVLFYTVYRSSIPGRSKPGLLCLSPPL
ncbi:uncharacterized protein [Heptranchias perlo]|uniref:uncharacterized protein isoform X2 n=1 Tax=Heptranchias perlo TaxID=212740 RepID=UPI00355A9642